MKLFTQLALVTAVATCGSAAYAMQSMDDAALSDTTGQDGITILIAPPTFNATQKSDLGITQSGGIRIGAAVLHDKDGFSGSLGGGAIILGDARQAGSSTTAGIKEMGVFGSSPIVVTIDASSGKLATGTGGTKPILNIGVALPSDLLIRTGDISVDGSNRAGITTGATNATVTNAATGGTTGNAVKILSSMDVALGGASLNIQLGSTTQSGITPGQTTMIKMSGTITDGLTISGLSLRDWNTMDASKGQFGGGDLGVSTITIKDTGTAAANKNLTLAAAVDVIADASVLTGFSPYVAAGTGALVITIGGPANDIMMQNVTLGSASSTLGDLQLINVQTYGTHLFVTGH